MYYRSMRRVFYNAARTVRASFAQLFLRAPLAVCVQRNAERPPAQRVERGVIKKMHALLQREVPLFLLREKHYKCQPNGSGHCVDSGSNGYVDSKVDGNDDKKNSHSKRQERKYVCRSSNDDMGTYNKWEKNSFLMHMSAVGISKNKNYNTNSSRNNNNNHSHDYIGNNDDKCNSIIDNNNNKNTVDNEEDICFRGGNKIADPGEHRTGDSSRCVDTSSDTERNEGGVKSKHPSPPSTDPDTHIRIWQWLRSHFPWQLVIRSWHPSFIPALPPDFGGSRGLNGEALKARSQAKAATLTSVVHQSDLKMRKYVSTVMQELRPLLKETERREREREQEKKKERMENETGRGEKVKYQSGPASAQWMRTQGSSITQNSHHQHQQQYQQGHQKETGQQDQNEQGERQAEIQDRTQKKTREKGKKKNKGIVAMKSQTIALSLNAVRKDVLNRLRAASRAHTQSHDSVTTTTATVTTTAKSSASLNADVNDNIDGGDLSWVWSYYDACVDAQLADTAEVADHTLSLPPISTIKAATVRSPSTSSSTTSSTGSSTKVHTAVPSPAPATAATPVSSPSSSGASTVAVTVMMAEIVMKVFRKEADRVVAAFRATLMTCK